MQSDAKKLTSKHQELTHSELMKVTSHVQRPDGEWILHTLMVDGCDVPFKFRRKTAYKNIKGRRVNLTYYPSSETVAGIEFEYMKVVRIKVS
jgi:hypothetical protein